MQEPQPEIDHKTSWRTAPLPSQLLSAQGHIQAVNEQWEHLTGYTADEAVGSEYADLVPPEHRHEFDRNMLALAETGRLDGAPCHIQCKDSSLRDVLVFAHTLEQDDKHVTRCMLVDATAMHETHKRIAESEERFRCLFELAPTPVVVHDGTHVVLANDAAVKFLGYGSVAELMGREVRGLVHPDSLEQVAARVKRMLAEDWDAPLAEEAYLRADGTAAHAETVASPLVVHGRRLIHVVALDTTGRRKVERELAESNERFRALFESSADSIVVHDGKHVLYANPAAFAHFGVSPETTVVGRRIEQLIHADSLALMLGRAERLLAGEPSLAPVEVRLLREDGSMWEAEAMSSVAMLDGKRVLQTTFRDLTTRKRTERELALYREELERLVEERTRSLVQARADLAAITAVVGHAVELRDPYTAGHQRRVAELAGAIARAIDLDEARVRGLEVAARMHDVGMIAVPGEIIGRPTRLSTHEFELIKVHAQAGFETLSTASLHDPIAEIVYQHHERLDGSGYPRGLVADDLLPEARILMVADVFEAMVSHRPYRASLGAEAAAAELRDGQGTRYDVEAVDACIMLMRDGFAFADG